MILKTIRLYLKNALLIAMAVMVIAGSMGFSYTVHYCHDKLSGVAFYPELGLNNSASCGCAANMPDTETPVSDSKPVLMKHTCCSNVSYFSKLAIESPVQGFSVLGLLQPAVISISGFDSGSFVSEKDNFETLGSTDLPPPIAGRKLVLFLSQQRIPFNTYTC